MARNLEKLLGFNPRKATPNQVIHQIQTLDRKAKHYETIYDTLSDIKWNEDDDFKQLSDEIEKGWITNFDELKDFFLNKYQYQCNEAQKLLPFALK